MSTDGQDTKWRRNIAENFNRLSRVHERYRRQTNDRRTGDSIVANVNVCSHALKILERLGRVTTCGSCPRIGSTCMLDWVGWVTWVWLLLSVVLWAESGVVGLSWQ